MISVDKRRTVRLGLLGCVIALAAATAAAPPARAASRPLETGIVDPITFSEDGASIAFRRARSAGTTVVRLSLDWRQVAPVRRPRRFDPTDPADTAYRWEQIDRQVRLAVAEGLEPILTITNAPRWGMKPDPRAGGLRRADPVEFGRFTLAAARRYGGVFRPEPTDAEAPERLPRIRIYQAWNEPNHTGRARLKAGAPDWYRQIVNRFAASVHSVHADNLVVAGGSSPFTTQTSMAPLQFMRKLLCMAGGSRPHPVCGRKTSFDVWSHHPYTSGGPEHSANGGDDVSLGDLPQMKRLLDASVRAGQIRSSRPMRFWVTEFAWDSRPPDPRAVPMALHRRWVAEALYRMWRSGVSLVAWWRIRDDPLRLSYYQSGLFFRASTIGLDKPKPSFYAFRFPFVAFAEEEGVVVWGRTPFGERRRVVVEQTFPGGWRSLGALTANENGIFSGVYPRAPGKGLLRARLILPKAVSVPFSLTRPPDRFYYPFGS
ncbi:MAG: hypothetical protein ABR521_13295 [Gaiellaceae bacterium]